MTDGLVNTLARTKPSVSVCLPVYNGETYIREAIRSILDQTFDDFELIISDNASTDRTEEICREMAARDRRARYVRSDANRGLTWNHNRAFELAVGRFVMWIGHDDVLGSEYLSRCVEVLERDPQVVLCYAGARHIDENGNVIEQVELQNLAVARRPSDRFRNTLYEHIGTAIYGLMKRDTLRQTALHRGFIEDDRVLLAEMALRGRFSLISEPLFSRRFHSLKTSSRFSNDPRGGMVAFDPANAGKAVFPEVLKTMGFLSAIKRASLPTGERHRCYRHLLKWLWTRRKRLRRDLFLELDAALQRWLPERQLDTLRFVKRRFFTRSWAEVS